MISAIIRRHNRLNGVIFSIIEFGLIALFIGAFATYYLTHHRFVLAIIAWGITLNCVPVVIHAIRGLREKQITSNHIGSFWDKKTRDQHKRENPHMLRDTLVLTVATLIPFVTFIAVLYELFTAKLTNRG